MDLNLCPCKVQPQEIVHVNSSRVRGSKTPFCVAFAPTAITFAYELGVRRSLARWKANEKLHPKIAKPALPHFGVHLESFRAGVKVSRTTSTIDEDITSMSTTNAPHDASEPVPLQGAITRARARQFY